jgi:CysZ protein
MIAFFKDFWSGITAYGKAVKLFNGKKLWFYVLAPMFVSLCLGVVMFLIRESVTQSIILLTEEALNMENWWEWARITFEWFIRILIWFTSFYLFVKFQKYVVLILLTPVLAYISEKTEQAINGREYPFNWGQFFRDVIRGVLLATWNLTLEIGILIFLWVITLLFPPLGVVTPWIGLVAGWYFFGYSLLDFTNERHRKKIKESNRTVWKMKGAAISLGMVFELALIIPFIGIVFIPVIGVAAATIVFLEKNDTLELVEGLGGVRPEDKSAHPSD